MSSMSKEELIRHTANIMRMLEDCSPRLNVFNVTVFCNLQENIRFASGLCAFVNKEFDHSLRQNLYLRYLVAYFKESGRRNFSRNYWFPTIKEIGFDEAKRLRVEFLKEFITHLQNG